MCLGKPHPICPCLNGIVVGRNKCVKNCKINYLFKDLIKFNTRNQKGY